jgi:hypothetical protein
MCQKRFPTSVKIGTRAIAFAEREIDEWINTRIEESRKSRIITLCALFASVCGFVHSSFDCRRDN